MMARMEFVLSIVSDGQRRLQAHVATVCRGRLAELEREAGETD